MEINHTRATLLAYLKEEELINAIKECETRSDVMGALWAQPEATAHGQSRTTCEGARAYRRPVTPLGTRQCFVTDRERSQPCPNQSNE